MICNNISIRDNGLCFAGMNVESLARKHGTPLYLMDEEKIRDIDFTVVDKQEIPEELEEFIEGMIGGEKT